MQITVTGQQIDIGESLREYAQAKLTEGVGKYFDHAIVGHVTFSREGPNYRTHIQVHVGKDMTWESSADHAEIHQSFAGAVEHLEKQLRRHKSKLRDHHKSADGADAASAD